MENENVTTEKRKRGRPRLNRMEVLKTFVTDLQKMFGPGPYTRDNLETIGDLNPLGLKLFSSNKDGYGKVTRLSHGSYMVPASWETEAPWMKDN